MTTKASHRRAWKKNESLIADFIGGERVPVSGRARGDQPDIKHNFLSPEVKLRGSLPKWMHDAMDQAEKSAKGNQTPCVILRQKRQRVADAFVIFRLSDFTRRFMPYLDE